jgi:hypothetical protein
MASETEVEALIDRFEKAVVRHEKCRNQRRNNSDSDREYDAAKLALRKALRRS